MKKIQIGVMGSAEDLNYSNYDIYFDAWNYTNYTIIYKESQSILKIKSRILKFYSKILKRISLTVKI